MRKTSLICYIFLFFSLFTTVTTRAEDVSTSPNAGQVVAAFNANTNAEQAVKIETKRKHEILFYMGITLLILIMLTAGFGMAMAFSGKQLFIPHMISAGITVFLSIAHAVVSIVWFFPYK